MQSYQPLDPLVNILGPKTLNIPGNNLAEAAIKEDPSIVNEGASNDEKTAISPNVDLTETANSEAEYNSEKTPETPAELPKKHVSGDDLYRRSSQYQTWSFSSEELHAQKTRANAQGQKSALKLFEETRATVQAEKPDVFDAHGSQLTSEILELISFEEEQKYLHFFGQQIVQICAHFKMPTQVKATAIAFFRRFYLVNSVMEFRPRNILYTVVFLAAKLENYFIAIDTFCSRLPKTKPEDILGLEFIVLLALKFTLLVHHAFRPLYGFFLDFQLLLLHPTPAMYDVNVDTIGQLYDRAKRWLNDHALLSDAPFLFTPPQIALAALYDCDKRITDRYLRRKFLHETGDGTEGLAVALVSEKEHFEHILKTIRKCIRVAKVETVTSREESTKIDEKCFFALNPLKLIKRRIKALSEPT